MSLFEVHPFVLPQATEQVRVTRSAFLWDGSENSMQFQNHFRSRLEFPRPLRMGGQNYFHYFPSSHTSSRRNKLFYMKSSSSSTLTSVQFMCCNLCEWVCFPIPWAILVPAADQTELSPRVCLAWSLCWTSVHRSGLVTRFAQIPRSIFKSSWSSHIYKRDFEPEIRDRHWAHSYLSPMTHTIQSWRPASQSMTSPWLTGIARVSPSLECPDSLRKNVVIFRTKCFLTCEKFPWGLVGGRQNYFLYFSFTSPHGEKHKFIRMKPSSWSTSFSGEYCFVASQMS